MSEASVDDDGDDSDDDEEQVIMIGIATRLQANDRVVMIVSVMNRCMAVITVMNMKSLVEVTMVMEVMMLKVVMMMMTMMMMKRGNDVSQW